MRNAHLVNELVTTYSALNVHYNHSEWQGARVLRLMMCALVADMYRVHHSPRVYYVAADFAGRSFWQSLRTSFNRRDGALMQFLGVPWFLFNDLVAKVTLALPKGYAPGSGPVRGRRRALDAMDLTALALRRYQTQGGQEGLQIDFGLPKTLVSRYLREALRPFDAFIAAFPGAEVRYPTLEEAQQMWSGVVSQFGNPPVQLEQLIVLTIDGTLTPVKKSTVLEVQQQYYSGHKGDGTNNILVKDMWGQVCDYNMEMDTGGPLFLGVLLFFFLRVALLLCRAFVGSLLLLCGL